MSIVSFAVELSLEQGYLILPKKGQLGCSFLPSTVTQNSTN